MLLNDSEEGIIQSYDPNIKLLGAINREGVTCYLDALLFAMFARLGSFEAMLYKNFEDPPRKRLATLLRLWVNTLRAGKLITTDIVRPRVARVVMPSRANVTLDEADTISTGQLRVERSSRSMSAGCLRSLHVHYFNTRSAATDAENGHISHWEGGRQR